MKKIAIQSYRSPPKPGYGLKTSTLPASMRNGYSSVSSRWDAFTDNVMPNIFLFSSTIELLYLL